MSYDWPCKACGAERPTAEGHDPCIANLPGVQNACCGHGYWRGYVHFENGAVIRGFFEGTPAEGVARECTDVPAASADTHPKGQDRETELGS